MSDVEVSKPPTASAVPKLSIEDLAAWRGSDLGNTEEFTHRLTGAEIAESDGAVEAVMQRGIDLVAIDRHKFELPQFGNYLTGTSKNSDLRGFVRV